MKGFTLIELLTVVVIIGVLAGIALPQYQKAVEKGRVAEALANGKVIIDAQNRLIDLAPNENVGTRRALDIILSGGTWTGNTTYTTDLFTYVLSDAGVSVQRNRTYNYTLNFFNNKMGNVSNSCEGDEFCNNLRHLGFAYIQTAESNTQD